MKLTVNRAIELVNTLRGRLSDLKDVRNKNLGIERMFGDGEMTRETIPLYDPSEVDERITRISNAILDLNSTIKESNARTEIAIDGLDKDALLSPMKSTMKK